MNVILNQPNLVIYSAFKKLQECNNLNIKIITFGEKLFFENEDELNIINAKQIYQKSIIGDFKDIDLSLFTIDIKNEFSWAEEIFYHMMDRFDTFKMQTYSQRKDVYKYFICYWLNYLQHNQIHLFCSLVAPHECFDFILYAICKKRGIDTLFFNYTSIIGKHIFSNDYKLPWEGLTDEITKNQDLKLNFTKSEHINDPEVSAFIKLIKGEYTDAKPKYEKLYDKIEKKENKQIKNFKYHIDLFKRSIKIFLLSIVLTISKNKNKIKITKKLLIYIKSIIISYEKKNLFKEYKKISIDVDLNVPYIYFPLHYQPENTTSPLGGLFVDQILAISTLSSSIPENWRIYVKEHPSQFRQSQAFPYSHIGRDSNYYKKIASVRKVNLVNMNFNQFDLIDNSRAISTITGTVGFEALIRGKAALVFGEAWYLNSPYVYKINNSNDVKNSLKLLNSEFEQEKINTFINCVIKVSHNLFFEDFYSKLLDKDLDIEENSQKLYQILENILFKKL